MARINPFKALRPARDKVHLVASRSVVTYPTKVLNAKLKENPFSFLQVIKPEHGHPVKSRTNSVELYEKVKDKFDDFCQKQILISDKGASFYIYRQVKDSTVYTGIIGAASIDDYLWEIIKKHEQTLTKREKIFRDYLSICNFNAEPVLLTYPDHRIIEDITLGYTVTRPEYDFTTTDTIHHQLWVMDNPNHVEIIQKAFDEISNIYIADGHHRCASSALLGLEKRMENPDFTGNEPFNYFMSYLIPESQLHIYDYNRVVKDLNGLTDDAFISKISVSFDVKRQPTVYKPDSIHTFSMYLSGNWYKLIPKKDSYNPADPVDNLDSQILTKNLLTPVLGIKDLKTDKRVNFIGGTEGMIALQKAVDRELAKVAFALYPVTTTQMKLIADTNNVMPPKSTWIEPKLRSGLIIYKF